MKTYAFDYTTKVSNRVKSDVDVAMISLNTIVFLAIADKCRNVGYKDCLTALKWAMGIRHLKYVSTPNGVNAEESLAELDACLERLASLVAGYESPYSYAGGVLKTPELVKQLARVEAKLDECYTCIATYVAWEVDQDEASEEEDNW